MDLTKYQEIKPTLKTGDAVLWKGTGILPDLIEGISKSPYSHASLIIRFSDYPDAVFLIEALATGVVMSNFETRLANESGGCSIFPLRYEFEDERAKIGARALSKLGEKYDYSVLVELAVEKVGPERGETICSELLQEVYGIKGDILTPGDISKLTIFGNRIDLP